MKPLDRFASECARWSDEYLLEQFRTGPASYTAPGYFDIIRAEVSRRALSLPPDPPPVEPAAPPTGSYVKRLWMGEVPLATTYWGWGVGLNILLAILIVVLAILARVVRGVALFMPLYVAYYYFKIAYTVFIMIAIWRSAGRYTGPRTWAVLARVAVILGAVGSVVGLAADSR